MSSIQWNDQTEMDKETRARMNSHDNGYDNDMSAIILLAVMIGLIIGILIGSALHDSMMHRGEKVIDIREK